MSESDPARRGLEPRPARAPPRHPEQTPARSGSHGPTRATDDSDSVICSEIPVTVRASRGRPRRRASPDHRVIGKSPEAHPAELDGAGACAGARPPGPALPSPAWLHHDSVISLSWISSTRPPLRRLSEALRLGVPVSVAGRPGTGWLRVTCPTESPRAKAEASSLRLWLVFSRSERPGSGPPASPGESVLLSLSSESFRRRPAAAAAAAASGPGFRRSLPAARINLKLVRPAGRSSDATVTVCR